MNHDLKRSCAQNAEACFILTNKYGKPDEEDAGRLFEPPVKEIANIATHPSYCNACYSYEEVQ